jgi:hypothetical protein
MRMRMRKKCRRSIFRQALRGGVLPPSPQIIKNLHLKPRDYPTARLLSEQAVNNFLLTGCPTEWN